ncbi:hypothetical protein, partial [Campylobacter troglodytis]|uniref:hypothetical protein n=1 Tax=Campylobacter troglodytis TaxID=654363 RepID=UPI0011579DE0
MLKAIYRRKTSLPCEFFLKLKQTYPPPKSPFAREGDFWLESKDSPSFAEGDLGGGYEIEFLLLSHLDSISFISLSF